MEYYVIIYLVAGIICGLICLGIASSRGMEGGFWWGFWLGIIGIIIVAVRPNEQKYENTNFAASNSSANSNYNWNDIVPVGGWRCEKCGKANQGYISICSCGTKKDEKIPNGGKDKKSNNTQRTNTISEAERIKHLKEYKELLDTGIISQEEFEKKKTQLLWENTIEIDNENHKEEEGKQTDKNQDDFDGINPKGEKAVYLLPANRDDFGVCPRCGTTQRKDRHVCMKCSVPLMYDEEK